MKSIITITFVTCVCFLYVFTLSRIIDYALQVTIVNHLESIMR